MWMRVGVEIFCQPDEVLTPAADTLSFQPAIFPADLELAVISVGIAFALFEMSERHATARPVENECPRRIASSRVAVRHVI
jgi:hypothetical protein